MFNVGDNVIVVKVEPLEGNKVAPPLKMDGEHSVKEIILDKEGNQHLDLGLLSEYEYVRSWETKEDLPRGDKVHWVHPSRVKLK